MTFENGVRAARQEPSHETLVAEAVACLDQWYKAGVPFFTKESIRAVSKQLKGPLIDGDTIFVKGLNGVTVEFKVATGRIRSFPQEPETEYELQKPHIRYTTQAALKYYLQRDFISLRRAFCSLQIASYMTKRSKSTKIPESHPRDSTGDHQDVLQLFEDNIRSWQVSSTCKQLKCYLKPMAAHRIGKVIGLACGPISYRFQSSRSTSAAEHALLLTLREALNVPCYAQDPAYSDVDKAVFKEFNIEVLEDPDALLEVDDSSIVYSKSPNIPVKEIVADIAQPAVLIWDCVGETTDHCTDPDSDRVRALIRNYDQYKLDADHDHFHRMVVYIRKPNVVEQYYNSPEERQL